MTNYVYIATSLDGYIATIEGSIDWLHDFPNIDETDYGYTEFMAGIDAIVMGRNTFEKVLSFNEWPYVKPVFVLSQLLVELPDQLQHKAQIINGQPGQVVAGLKRRGLQNLYIDGGQTITSFLREDLIDELIITKIPMLLGDGIPLFGHFTNCLRFVHKETKTYSNSLVKSHYTRDK